MVLIIIVLIYSLTNLVLAGEPSLQNTLELAGRILKPLPGHASRELLVLFGSLTTCDPGDIITTIQVIICSYMFRFFPY